MKTARTLGLALVLGCASSGGSPEPRQVAVQGEELYHRYCGACHGRSADGAGPVATLLDPPPSDLTRLSARHGGVFPQAAVLRWIDGRDPVVAHGTREMPIWGERFAAGLPPSAHATAQSRGTSLVIMEYLRGIQR